MPDCLTCGYNHKCCMSYNVNLTKDEAKNFKYKRLRRVFKDKKYLGFVWTLTCQEDGSCMYFDHKTKKCKIYDDRPVVCRKWNECEKWL